MTDSHSKKFGKFCKKSIIINNVITIPVYEMRKFTLLFSVAITLSACSSPPSQVSDTVRICNDNGCSVQPRSTATFQMAPTAAELEEDSRYQALAEQAKQNPRAAFDLALRFYRGDGVKRNTYQALTWMRESAEQGNADAQLALGRLYLSGLEEMGPDPAEAESWLLLAAERGNPEAKKLLEQAQAAKKEEIKYQRWLNENRLMWRSYWVTGYHYGTCWRSGGWVYC